MVNFLVNTFKLTLLALLPLLFSNLLACSVKRRVVPLGEIPTAKSVSQADVEYGQNVLAQLTQQFPLSQSDRDLNQVRDIIDTLVDSAGASYDPWHSYVLEADQIVNAGATRGNFIFVWSGLLRVVENETELATILAHEIGHVLAGHTESNPQEEANKMISSAAGLAAREVLRTQTAAGQFGQLAEALIAQAVRGLIVNPESQRQELEADQIGLFLLADAGFDPRAAVAFWFKVQNDPRFGANSIEFFSTHPTSRTRLDRLKQILHNAEARYRNRGKMRSTAENPWTSTNSRASRTSENNHIAVTTSSSAAPGRENPQPWIVDLERTAVFDHPEDNQKTLTYLRAGEEVQILCHFPDLLRVIKPVKGFIAKSAAVPRDRPALKIRRCKPIRRQPSQ